MAVTLSSLVVYVYSSDPILLCGVTSQLRHNQDLRVGNDVTTSSVAVLASDEVDDEIIRMTRMISRNGPKVVLVASNLDNGGVIAGAEAGAIGFLRRAEAVPERLSAVIRCAAAGESSVPRDVVTGILGHLAHLSTQVLAPKGITLSGFTDRELQVLRLVADGMETADIAKRLSYSERTVKGVLHGVTTRLQLKNRSQAVAYAVRQGLI